LTEFSTALLIRQVEHIWNNAGAWPEFREAMRLALTSGVPQKGTRSQSFSRWAALPGLCCQAAGGKPAWADGLTLAWLLYYQAAHLMDSVQDQDDPDSWWRERGAATALSAATGLFFSASLALISEQQEGAVGDRATQEAARRFYRGFMVMCSGQYLEIYRQPTTLEEYWRWAEAKSGAFFGLGCASAARLSTDQPARLEAFDQFGRQIGILVQIRDDLDDIRIPEAGGRPFQRPQVMRSLPVMYARDVLPPAEQGRLLRSLHDAPGNPEAAQTALELVEGCGAALYIQSEMARCGRAAVKYLDIAAEDGEAKRKLTGLLSV
jgi:geranylgeranyl pyrophosphate synthase